VEICSKPDCQEAVQGQWQGNLLCRREYRVALLDAFARANSAWDGGVSPPAAFRVAFARVLAELAELRGESYLSLARVRDRSYNFAKEKLGVRFDLVRHLHAWDGRQPMTRLVESWSFDIEALEYLRESVRAWAVGDPL
jgi:hypothetical protein